MLQTDSRRVGDENLATDSGLNLKPLVLTGRVVIRNPPTPAPREQPAGMGYLLLESRRGTTFQKCLIGSSDLWKIKKIPAGSLSGWSGGRGF
jgi:hypothetical protein